MIHLFSRSRSTENGTDIQFLDLTFLATGNCQHAFVKTGPEIDNCVYKIPAVHGEILRSHHYLNGYFWPENAYERVLSIICLSVPHRFHDRIYQRLATYVGTSRWKKANKCLKPIEKVSRLLFLGGQIVLDARRKRTRSKSFPVMLNAIDYLSEQGLTDILLPTTIIRHAEAELRVDDKTYRYEGPMIVQQRAEQFFDHNQDVRAFEWMDIVEAQRRLWRRGLALLQVDEVLGPNSWAVHEGTLRLADTSALTTDLRQIRQRYQNEQFDAMQKKLMDNFCDNYPRKLMDEYFRFIRSEITLEKVERIWRTDLTVNHRDIDLNGQSHRQPGHQSI